MTIRAFLFAAAAALSLGACAPLTAEAPLFSPADQVGPPPLVEGVWIFVSEECPARNARRRGRLPAECRPGELRRLPDGAWSFRFQDHVFAAEEMEPFALRLVIVPATERETADGYAPLYVIEYTQSEPASDDPSPRYVSLAPIGEMPAREVGLLDEIGCHAILRDGPIEGITPVVDERGEVVRCIASSQAAVREAVRRDVIESIGFILQDEERLVFVRP